MKQRLYMVQVNGRYGENVYLPYSVGLLWAYARTFPEIAAAYDMIDFLYLKEPIEAAVARLVAPDLIAISCYVWNWEWSKAFARAVKERWPNCRIVVGGVQVQDESPEILLENPQFDFAIYGEGEGAFADFLRARACNGDSLSSVGSLIWRNGPAIRVNPRRAFTDLAELRSPYLDGVFDAMLAREPRWQVLQETTRGCPYACTFCAWGQAALSDLRQLPLERVLGEIEWFGQHHAPYLDNADANFGIVKRDVDIARHMVATKAKYGYPQTFRAAFAKNSNEVIWEIANLMHGAGMLKSVTLAMQSMDADVLVNIKRKNIKFDKFGDLIKRYDDAGIPTYTELILGLPGETLDQFLDGVEKNLAAGMHQGLFMYVNLMLNNTEQHQADYIATHGLKTLPLKAMLTHGTPDESAIREVQPVIVETAAMTHDEWKRGWLYAKVIEVFHSQGLLRDIAVALHGRGLSYRDFYGSLIRWIGIRPTTVAAREVAGLKDVLERALADGVWDCVDPRLGDISWPPEEFAFARICLELDRFYDEVDDFLIGQGAEDEEIAAQRAAPARPTGDTVVWAREMVWYGRKGYANKKKLPPRD